MNVLRLITRAKLPLAARAELPALRLTFRQRITLALARWQFNRSERARKRRRQELCNDMADAHTAHIWWPDEPTRGELWLKLDGQPAPLAAKLRMALVSFDQGARVQLFK